MKKVFFILMYISLLSITQAADPIGFNAEDDTVYYQAGALWEDVEEEDALGGISITGTANLPEQSDENTRFYSFYLPAGTYNVFVRIWVDDNNRTTQAAADNDSFYLSNNSLAENAGTIDFNGIGGGQAPPYQDEVCVNDFGWVLVMQSYSDVRRSYVQAEDGTAYFKVSPRENGCWIDAFSFVLEEEAETVTVEELNRSVEFFIRGAATDPVPADSDVPEVDSKEITELSWLAAVDPNIASVDGFDLIFGTDPNFLNMIDNVLYEDVTNPFILADNGIDLDYEMTYFWRVDSYVVWDSNDIDDTGPYSEKVEGYEWTFTTYPDDRAPDVDLGSDIVTSVEFLPASLTGTVDDYGEDDIASLAWEVLGTTATEQAKQMITRGQDLSAITSEPNLLMDWTGTDTRQPGNPMYLILKGLPADTYDWTSYHHDAENQNGVFDVTVYDASGSATTTDIQISAGGDPPVTTFDTTITSNGVDDVVLVFDLQDATEVALQFFLMNGFELSDGSSSLDIDFGTVASATDPNAVNVMPGYQAYTARHEVSETFTEQSYSAFGGTVSILPSWGGIDATVTDTTNDPSSASQSATLETDWPGAYVVQLTATDDDIYGPEELEGSDTVTVSVAENPCVAAQMSTNWTGFSISDFNEDCVVTIADFADLAAAWLDDRNLTAQE